MLQALQRKMRDREDGFTLIELMVVVLIIAILLAIAIPTFLGAREKAQNRAAQADLRNALTAAKTIYVDTQSYSQSASDLLAVEPSLNFVALASADLTSEVGVLGTASDIVFVRVSETGDVYCIAESESAGTSSGYASSAPADYAACVAYTNDWTN